MQIRNLRGALLHPHGPRKRGRGFSEFIRIRNLCGALLRLHGPRKSRDGLSRFIKIRNLRGRRLRHRFARAKEGADTLDFVRFVIFAAGDSATEWRYPFSGLSAT